MAAAPLDDGRLADYRGLQRATYTEGDYLRQALQLAGAVVLEEDPDAFSGDGFGYILPKRPFTAIEGPDVLIREESPANDLVLEQLAAAYTAVAMIAEPVEGEGTDAAAQAVRRLREAGRSPDFVLVPQDIFVRELLSGHPEWEWAHDASRDAKHFATISGVLVYDVGPHDATALLVCELAASVTRIERVRLGDDSPVRVSVNPIDAGRAAAILATGTRVAGVDRNDLAAQGRALTGGYVEVHVDMDVRWEPAGGEPAAFRIELPGPADRRRH